MSAFCMAFSTQVAAIDRISLAFSNALTVALGVTTAWGCLLIAAMREDTAKRMWNLTCERPARSSLFIFRFGQASSMARVHPFSAAMFSGGYAVRNNVL